MVLCETVEKSFVYITTAAAAAGATVQECQVVARLSPRCATDFNSKYSLSDDTRTGDGGESKGERLSFHPNR